MNKKNLRIISLLLIIVVVIIIIILTMRVDYTKGYETSSISDYNVYGESINIEVDNNLDNQYSLLNAHNGEINQTIDTKDTIDSGITPLKFEVGTYFIINNDKLLISDEDIDTSFITTPKDNQRYYISLETDENGYLILSKEKTNDSSCDILIDAGHGGLDGGSDASGKETEAEVNLAMANYLDEALSDLGYQTCMTRVDDVNPGDEEGLSNYGVGTRTGQAFEKEANYVISIHNNSGGGSGFEIYSSIFTTQDFAIAVGEQIINLQNASEKESTEKVNSTYSIFEMVHDEAIDTTDYMFMIRETAGRAISSTNEDTNPYYDSVIGSETLLVELGYMDNYLDYINLSDPTFQNDIMNLMADGIDNYIQSK